ncbi:MAG TPA: hypothetical protein VKG45_11920 [Actinomycetes bacterium]|nr:hypothetical protein [Actinomycetes bacterium]
MTEFDPEATTELHQPETPHFPVVMRGYDRWQVDNRFAEFTIQLERERGRAEELEDKLGDARAQLDALRDQPPPSFMHLGAEAAKLLEQAGESADRLVAEAQDRAGQIEQDARGKATQLVAEAEQRSRDLEASSAGVLQQAQDEAEQTRHDARQESETERARAHEEARIVLAEARDATNTVWQEAQRERMTIETEIQRLDGLRRQVFAQLERVRNQLVSVLGDVIPEDRGPGELDAGAETEAIGEDTELDELDEDDDIAAARPLNERRIMRERARAAGMQRRV